MDRAVVLGVLVVAVSHPAALLPMTTQSGYDPGSLEGEFNPMLGTLHIRILPESDQDTYLKDVEENVDAYTNDQQTEKRNSNFPKIQSHTLTRLLENEVRELRKQILSSAILPANSLHTTHGNSRKVKCKLDKTMTIRCKILTRVQHNVLSEIFSPKITEYNGPNGDRLRTRTKRSSSLKREGRFGHSHESGGDVDKSIEEVRLKKALEMHYQYFLEDLIVLFQYDIDKFAEESSRKSQDGQRKARSRPKRDIRSLWHNVNVRKVLRKYLMGKGTEENGKAIFRFG